MKKILTIVLVALSFGANAQDVITPYKSKIDTGIIQKSANYSISKSVVGGVIKELADIVATKVDSVYKKDGTDSVFIVKNGVLRFAFVDISSGSREVEVLTFRVGEPAGAVGDAIEIPNGGTTISHSSLDGKTILLVMIGNIAVDNNSLWGYTFSGDTLDFSAMGGTLDDIDIKVQVK